MLRLAHEWGDRIPIGLIYREEKKSYEERYDLSKMPPLVDSDIEDIDIRGILKAYA